MNSVNETYGAVLAGGSVVTLARVETADGSLVQPTDITSASYTITEQPLCSGTATPVVGHAENTISPVSILFTDLQTGPAWEVDTLGYNFRHTVETGEHPAFPTAGREYSVLYRLTPTAGQPILLRYSIKAV